MHPSEWRVASPFIVFTCHQQPPDSAAVRAVTDSLRPPSTDASEFVWFRVNVLRRRDSAADSLEAAEVRRRAFKATSLHLDTFADYCRRSRRAINRLDVIVAERSLSLRSKCGDGARAQSGDNAKRQRRRARRGTRRKWPSELRVQMQHGESTLQP